MAAIHSVRDYSPFSARSSSATTIDETYLYGAEVNYTYSQHRLAYDTDAFEHRLEPMPYSLLPIEAEVLLARIFGSVATAQILCHFLFPALTAWLLIELFLNLNASVAVAALFTLVTLTASFSARTLGIGILDLLLHGLHSGFIETLEASRNPNPNMTFPLFLAALLAQAVALLRRSTAYSVLAGVLGGLLFYSYIYYAMAWSAAATLVLLLALLQRRSFLRLSLITWLATVGMSAPFLLWVRAAKKSGGYFYRSERLGMVRSHLPDAHDRMLSFIFAACLALIWAGWKYAVSKHKLADNGQHQRAGIFVLVFGCAAAGGILGMNMQLVTGFSLQAGHHFPHMVIQPALILLLLTVYLGTTGKTWQRHHSLWAKILFLALFSACIATQVEAAVNSAPLHRIVPWQRELFHWLNQNTHPGDVVATTSLDLAISIPVYSQNCTLMVNGSRTQASDHEILDRYLLAEALTRTPASTVAERLAGAPELPGSNKRWNNYPAFFFEHSSYLAGPGKLKPSVIRAAAAQYSSLNPANALKHFRVDYLYVENRQEPVKIPGVDWRLVLTTGEGSLWQLDQAPGAYEGATK